VRLTDCFMELIAYTAYFQKSVARKQPAFDQVKADVLRLVTQSEVCLKKDLFPKEDYDLARFAVCAWVDETILASAWKEKERWQREQLQRLYYNTFDAGEEFFDRLNNLGLHQRDVREIYYLCMAMGFMGRYIHQGDEYLLSQVKASNLKILLGSSLGMPSLERMELFSEAYPPETDKARVPVRMGRRFQLRGLTLFAIITPMVLYAVLFVIYRFVLNGITENFFRVVS
jgi:type VI secretion system protein ImpK